MLSRTKDWNCGLCLDLSPFQTVHDQSLEEQDLAHALATCFGPQFRELPVVRCVSFEKFSRNMIRGAFAWSYIFFKKKPYHPEKKKTDNKRNILHRLEIELPDNLLQSVPVKQQKDDWEKKI